MKQEKIDRINELAHISKQRELTADELAEREILRKEFLADFRAGLKAQLDMIEIVDQIEEETVNPS